MRTRWLSTVACSALLALTATRAAAANPVKEAQERYQEGNRRFSAGDYDGARVAYQQSLVLVPHGSTYRNVGLAEMKLGDPVSALKHLRSALKSADLQADRRTMAQHDLDDAYAATGHLTVSTSAGARITVDGKDVEGQAPLSDPIDVTSGKHSIEAHLVERSVRADVDAKAGVLVQVDLPIIEPSPITTSPLPPVAEPSGPKTGGVTPGPDLPASTSSATFWTARREVGVVGAGAGLVAMGVGAYFASQAGTEQTRAVSAAAGLQPGACASAAPPSGCSAEQAAHSAQHSDAVATYVFLGAGAAVLLAGGALLLWPESSSTRTALLPMASPAGGGLLLQGEF